MRNWPYAYALLQDSSQSAVAGHVGIAPMPAGPGGSATAALGGAELAINAHSADADLAYELIDYLLQPAQLLERARSVGQFPPRPALYETPELAAAIGIPPADARRIIERAVPRPVTPVYSQLSEILQIALHRALSNLQAPDVALHEAAVQIRGVLDKVRLAPVTR
jgi:multiple sugar transport system substrate-binding protein